MKLPLFILYFDRTHSSQCYLSFVKNCENTTKDAKWEQENINCVCGRTSCLSKVYL